MSTELKKLAQAARRLEILEERERQQAPGGLMAFVRYFWKILEPNQPFVEGWAIEAIAEHLEAVHRGQINRLLINVPPGFSKSLLTNCFFPAWEWSAMNMSDRRYLSFSYAAHLTRRDNRKLINLLKSQRFIELWGEYRKFELVKEGEELVSTNGTGWKFATSVGGVGTGERGNRILCFPADAPVLTEYGPMPIADIVRDRRKVRVWSTDVKTGKTSLQPIIGWIENPGSKLVEVQLNDGSSLKCTPDHKLWVYGLGWVQASNLRPGDMLPSLSISNLRNTYFRNIILFAKLSSCLSRSQNIDNFYIRKLRSRSAFSGSPVRRFQIKAEMLPYASASNSIDCADTDPKHCSKEPRWDFMHGSNFPHHIRGQMGSPIFKCSMGLAIGNILGTSSILKIIQSWIGPVAIQMSNLLFNWARTDKSSGNKLVNKYVSIFPISSHGYPWIASIQNWFKDSALNFKGAVNFANKISKFPRDDSGLTVYPAEIRNKIITESGSLFPGLSIVSNVAECGHVDKTFCLTVKDNHNLYAGCGKEKVFILSANCDDPHAIRDTESDIVRNGTVRWFRETMSNRLNNEDDAIIVIMQRVHEDDVSGNIIADEQGLGYTQLRIPMEYIENDPCSRPTKIGWVDPRTTNGELAWPERYSSAFLRQFKVISYAWASQYMQDPEPRGGAIILRDWWRLWESPESKQCTLCGSYEVERVKSDDPGSRWHLCLECNKHFVSRPRTFPLCSYILASLDTSYTEKERNDPSAMTIWGIFQHPKTNEPGIVLMDAWRKWLRMNAEPVQRFEGENESDYRERCKPKWGLVEWTVHTCRRFKVDCLLIENKASGITLQQELQIQYGREMWSTILKQPEGDKEARAHSVVGIFANGLVWAPESDWANLMIEEAAKFPFGKYRDLTDSMTQALRHIRNLGLIQFEEERLAEFQEENRQRPRLQPLYPV